MLIYKLTVLLEQKKLDEKRNITFEDLSKESGVGLTTLKKMKKNENLNFKTDALDKLCAYFQCSVCDLVEYHEGP